MYQQELEELRQVLAYNADTGDFHWLVDRKGRYGRAGDIAGAIDAKGYRTITARGRYYKAHRLAFLFYFGRWPHSQIDHINGQRTDNRICNLRECTSAENSQNRGMNSDNKSGFRGVCWDGPRKRWKAQITSGGKVHYLGLYDRAEDAHKAYLEARSGLFKFQPAPRAAL